MVTISFSKPLLLLPALVVGLGASYLASTRPASQVDFSGAEYRVASLSSLSEVTETAYGPMAVYDVWDREAASAALADLSGAMATEDGWRLEAESLGAADRVSLALLEAGYSFARSGQDPTVLTGAGAVPDWPSANPEATLAALVELEGTRFGPIATGDPDHLAWAQDLADTAGIETQIEDGQLVPANWDAVTKLAGLTYPCSAATVVCSDTGQLVYRGTEQSLLVATTGPIASGQSEVPPSADGGVDWTNLEAQAYRPGAVSFTDSGLEITASPNPVPSTRSVPFYSGMVMADQTFEFGRIDIEATIPTGEGAWPAFWLLGLDGCVAPGRCEGFETDRYLEIDIAEVNTSVPGELHSAAHWFDEGLVSETSVAVTSAVSDGQPHVFSLVRRPGLLVWLVDGEEVFSLAGEASGEAGPHRLGDMSLIINLAIGGTFSGDRALGPGSPWLGDARVPAGFPNLSWDTLTLGVKSIEVSQLG